MEKIIRPSLSFENSKRILEQGLKIDRQIDLMADLMQEQREQMIHEVNKAVFELAEKKNMSIYNICFHTIPVERCVDTKFDYKDPLQARCSLDIKLELVPIEFELEKKPNYWENKYYRLKEKIQELIARRNRYA